MKPTATILQLWLLCMVSAVWHDPIRSPVIERIWLLFADPARWWQGFRFSISDTCVDYNVFVVDAQLVCLICCSIRSTTRWVFRLGQSCQACVAVIRRVSRHFNCAARVWWLVWFLVCATRFCGSVSWRCVAWCNECAERSVSMLPLSLLVKRTAQVILFVITRQIHQQHERNGDCG